MDNATWYWIARMRSRGRQGRALRQLAATRPRYGHVCEAFDKQKEAEYTYRLAVL